MDFFPALLYNLSVNRLLEDGLTMKKIFASIGIFLALTILFSSCDLPTGKVITVGSVEVDKEIYTYYLDSAVASSEGVIINTVRPLCAARAAVVKVFCPSAMPKMAQGDDAGVNAPINCCHKPVCISG